MTGLTLYQNDQFVSAGAVRAHLRGRRPFRRGSPPSRGSVARAERAGADPLRRRGWRVHTTAVRARIEGSGHATCHAAPQHSAAHHVQTPPCDTAPLQRIREALARPRGLSTCQFCATRPLAFISHAVELVYADTLPCAATLSRPVPPPPRHRPLTCRCVASGCRGSRLSASRISSRMSGVSGRGAPEGIAGARGRSRRALLHWQRPGAGARGM